MEFRTLFHGCANPLDGVSPGPGLLLARTEAEWARRWETMTSGEVPGPDVPSVDWASEMVVVLVLGKRPTSGYTVTIEQVTVRGQQVRVSACEERPAGIVACAVTYPIHAVAVPVHNVRDDLYLDQQITTSRDKEQVDSPRGD